MGTAMTLQTIKEYNEKHSYMLCPHSAVGVSAIHQLGEVNHATVCLATAHEAKFPNACKRAVDPLPTPPPQLSKLFGMKVRSSNCPNDLKTVQAFMEKRIEDRINGEKGVVCSSNSGDSCGCPFANGQAKKVMIGAAVAAFVGILATQLAIRKR